MPLEPTTADGPAITRHRFGSAAVMLVAVACLAVAGAAGLAFAKTDPMLHSARNSMVGKTIVVDSHGLTVYELSPETTHHLLCTKTKGCFAAWSPLTVRSAKTKLTATGANGRLGLLHRNGFFQLTLAGHPLYHFIGDSSRRGNAKGQGLHTFGGHWHVVTASGTTPPPPMTTTTTTTSYPGY
jgi:predicted lipoprotein with Yx(FWY)xxD motif